MEKIIFELLEKNFKVEFKHLFKKSFFIVANKFSKKDSGILNCTIKIKQNNNRIRFYLVSIQSIKPISQISKKDLLELVRNL